MGVSDLYFSIVTDIVLSCLNTALLRLPLIALVAKITPKRVEATVFAFITSTWSLSDQFIQPMFGVWINNNFVGVTAEKMDRYPTLCLFSLYLSFLGFLLIPLIPT